MQGARPILRASGGALWLALGMALATLSAYAGLGPNGFVEGVVLSFNLKTVKLRLDNGRLIRVNRSSVPEAYSLAEGSRVTAYLDTEEWKKAFKTGKAPSKPSP